MNFKTHSHKNVRIFLIKTEVKMYEAYCKTINICLISGSRNDEFQVLIPLLYFSTMNIFVQNSVKYDCLHLATISQYQYDHIDLQ